MFQRIVELVQRFGKLPLAVRVAVFVAIVLATRIPFHMKSLDEFDSANFALSLIQFNIAAHQPHPPGQILYVLLGRFFKMFAQDEVGALALASSVFGSLALLPYFLLVRSILSERIAWLSVLLTASTYGYWLNNLRPISDSVGVFFVLVTVALLIAGLTDRRYFYWGVVLLGISLGIKQLSLYFLLPLVLLVFITRLKKDGARSVAVGALLLLLTCTVWIVPTVNNTGGFANYITLTSALQRGIWQAGALAISPSLPRAIEQFQTNFITPWGHPVTAILVYLLLGVGLSRTAWTRERAAFFLFGLTTALYCFWFLVPQSRYTVYYLPVFATLAACGIQAASKLGSTLLVLRHGTTAITCALLISNVVITSNAVVKAATFVAPAEAAVDYLQHRLPKLEGTLLIADDMILERHLRYYSLEHQFTVTSAAKWDLLSSLVGSGTPIFFLSTASFSNPSTPLLSHWSWGDQLYYFTGRTQLQDVYLYEVSGIPPNIYSFDSEAIPWPFLKGIFQDRWISESASILLPSDLSEQEFVLEGTIPDSLPYSYPFRITVNFSDLSSQTIELASPGDFMISLPVSEDIQDKVFTASIQSHQYFVPAKLDSLSGDLRRLSFIIKRVEVRPATPAACSLAGWYGLEQSGSNWWRWTDSHGQVSISLSQTTDVYLHGRVSSVQVPNRVDVVVNGEKRITLEINERDVYPFGPIRLHLKAGKSVIEFVSHNTAITIATDSRPLAIAVHNLSLTAGRGGPRVCNLAH